jgi:hypothetical protein
MVSVLTESDNNAVLILRQEDGRESANPERDVTIEEVFLSAREVSKETLLDV